MGWFGGFGPVRRAAERGAASTYDGAVDPLGAWEELPLPLRRCFELAWEALGAGTYPVGAAVADEGGAIAAAGRNRIYEAAGPSGELAGSRLAHAEVNALAQLEVEPTYWRHTLYSTLEPCPLCVGAALVSTIGRIVYAGGDLFGGGTRRQGAIEPFVRRPQLVIEGPLAGPFGILGEALALLHFVLERPAHDYVGEYRERRPALLRVAQGLERHDLPRAAASGARLDEMLPAVWPLLASDGSAGGP
jgi:tRNA(Arg) A34 adenosine deaminase TadA